MKPRGAETTPSFNITSALSEVTNRHFQARRKMWECPALESVTMNCTCVLRPAPQVEERAFSVVLPRSPLRNHFVLFPDLETMPQLLTSVKQRMLELLLRDEHDSTR